MNTPPKWPARLTRDQQRAVKQRQKDFNAAVKRAVRAAGWRFASHHVFRQSGDWFVSMFLTLLWERGVEVRMMIKPMTLDPLFWNIVGLSENEMLPLSFRATGAWVLTDTLVASLRSAHDFVGLDTIEVESLAAEVLSWGNQKAGEILESISVASMIKALPSEDRLRAQDRTFAVCLHILENDLDGASRLCRVSYPAPDLFTEKGGGFYTTNADGSVSSFLEQALDWIARRRRGELHVV